MVKKNFKEKNSKKNGKKPIKGLKKKDEPKKSNRKRVKKRKFDENQNIPDFSKFETTILTILEKSKTPIGIDQIARKTRKSKEFVFIWLCSVGKSIKSIQKVNSNTYTLVKENARQ